MPFISSFQLIEFSYFRHLEALKLKREIDFSMKSFSIRRNVIGSWSYFIEQIALHALTIMIEILQK